QLVLASPPASRFVSGLVPKDPQNPYTEEDSWNSIVLPYLGVVFVLTVLAVILIGLAGALPRPWSWAPSWVLAASVIAGWASNLLFMASIRQGGAANVVSRMLFELPGVGVMFLGVVAIVLGLRATRHVAPV
ncbi:MAG: hypothetical protein WA971_03920, partial [Microbacterium sp.]